MLMIRLHNMRCNISTKCLGIKTFFNFIYPWSITALFPCHGFIHQGKVHNHTMLHYFWSVVSDTPESLVVNYIESLNRHVKPSALPDVHFPPASILVTTVQFSSISLLNKIQNFFYIPSKSSPISEFSPTTSIDLTKPHLYEN